MTSVCGDLLTSMINDGKLLLVVFCVDNYFTGHGLR